MTFDELLHRMSTEPDRAITVRYRAISEHHRALLASGRALSVSEVLAARSGESQAKVVRYGHRLGRPIEKETIARWKASSAGGPIPDDLEQLLLRANGIHLWSNLDTGRSYEGLAPIDEWRRLRDMVAADASAIPPELIAITYIDNASSYVVLDVRSGTYALVDMIAANSKVPVASNVEGLLKWLWKSRIPPREDRVEGP